MEIDPGKLTRVYNDAHAMLVPNTPLKDMQIDIAPGTRVGRRAQGERDHPGRPHDARRSTATS